MRFSKTELRILEQVANNNKSVKGIALALKKSKMQVYRTGWKLINKDIVARFEGSYEPKKNSHGILLLHLLSQYPSLIMPLSGSGVKLFTATLGGKTIEEITQETWIKRTMAFKKLKEARRIGMIIKQGKKYLLNEKIWPALKEFLLESKKYDESNDPRIPANSTIFFKNEKEIVFSSPEMVDAALTGFSAYSSHGIKIISPEITYYLPKKTLGVKDIFLHSLHVANRDRNSRHLIFTALFYAKFKDKLPTIKHPLLDLIKRILAGEKIPGYPDLNEIREKADIYDIQI